MGLLRMAALGGLAYWGYNKYKESQGGNGAAFSSSQPDGQFRNSGPGAMRDEPKREWTKTDEEMDQTYPASDPPANY